MTKPTNPSAPTAIDGPTPDSTCPAWCVHQDEHQAATERPTRGTESLVLHHAGEPVVLRLDSRNVTVERYAFHEWSAYTHTDDDDEAVRLTVRDEMVTHDISFELRPQDVQALRGALAAVLSQLPGQATS